MSIYAPAGIIWLTMICAQLKHVTAISQRGDGIMNIVLEGPDNSGKSTLAKILSQHLGKEVYASEGPEKFPGELRERVERYRAYKDVIFDRHPCVSDIIYGRFRQKRSSLSGEQESIFYAEQPLLIYCDPLGRGLNGHVEKKHDSREHVAMVQHNYDAILGIYQKWALNRANIIYRIGDDPRQIIKFCRDFDPVQDVEDFHRRFNRGYDGAPRVLPPDLADFRERFQDEELKEYKDSAFLAENLIIDAAEGNASEPEAVTKQLALMLDALCDLTYVVIGTAQLHGFNFREAWRRVHAANMKKKAVQRRSDSTRHSTFDVIKPENWQAPDHTDLVRDHIHR